MTVRVPGESIAYTAVPATPGYVSGDHTVAWSFDDGTTASTASTSKSWSTTGTHLATATATNSVTGGTGSATKSVLISGGSTAPNNANTARANHESILLDNGKILVVGGGSLGVASTSVAITSCELFNPTNNTFTATGSLNTARMAGFKLVKLASGDILAIGGKDLEMPDYSGWWRNFMPGAPTVCTGVCEIYSVSTGLWATTGSLATARSRFGVAVLPSGKVMVFGGYTSSGVSQQPLSSTEVYDPMSGLWSAGPAMPEAKHSMICTALSDGSIFIALGGKQYSGSSAFDYSLLTWVYTEGGSFVSKLSHPDGVGRGRSGGGVVVVGDSIIISGGNGFGGSGNDTGSVYSIANNTWTNSATDTTGYATWVAPSVASGSLVFNGSTSKRTSVFNGSTFTHLNDVAYDNQFDSACAYGGNKVLLTGGGTNSSSTTQASIYLV